MINPSDLVTSLLLSILLVALASPAPPYDTDNSEKLGEQIVGKKQLLEQGKIVLVTPEETFDKIADNLSAPTLTQSEISTADDSSFLEVVSYLAAIPLLAISPFLLLGLAIFLLPLLAGGSLILILMILAGSVAVVLPLIFGMPLLFIPILLLAALDGEQPILLQEELSEDAGMQINISHLISALTTNSKDVDWNASNLTSTTTKDDRVNLNDSVNSIPHSAVPRLLSW